MTDKEIIIMMTTKCADLERKLAEAREDVKKAVKQNLRLQRY